MVRLMMVTSPRAHASACQDLHDSSSEGYVHQGNGTAVFPTGGGHLAWLFWGVTCGQGMFIIFCKLLFTYF